jgi:hypothetical protein
MTLFDPHSHHLIHQLRQEQLARKAARRKQLGLDAIAMPSFGSRALVALRLLATRRASRSAANPAPVGPASPEPR